MCAGLLMLDKAPGDPVKGSIMHQKNTEKKEPGTKGQEYIKNFNREERGRDKDTNNSNKQLTTEQINSLIKEVTFNPIMLPCSLCVFKQYNAAWLSKKKIPCTESFSSSNEPEKIQIRINKN